MNIVELTAQNIKRLRAVKITPSPGDHVVQITGRNAAGKSSVLDAITMALGGADHHASMPIRRGEERAEVVVDLGELVVRRTFTGKGSYLSVETTEGARYPSPQAMLDKLYGDLTFDPLEFMRLKSQQQRDRILNVCGLTDKLDALQAKYSAAFTNRTDVNRVVKRLQGALVEYEDLPPTRPGPVDVSELLEWRRARQRARDEVVGKVAHINDLDRDRTNHDRVRQRLEREIVLLQRELAIGREKAHEMQAHIDEAKSELAAARAECDRTDIPSIDEIDRQIAESQQVAVMVQRFEAADRLRSELNDAVQEAHELNVRLERIETGKLNLLHEHQAPVPGLSIRDDGVYFNDVPLDQASAAEQLTVSLAIGMAANPELRIMLIRDGSLLDSHSLDVISQFAAERDYQVWIESVDESGKVGIVIEDGEVVATNGAPTNGDGAKGPA